MSCVLLPIELPRLMDWLMGILGDYSRWDDVHVFWSEFRGFPWENEF